jgi:ligand-binding sensor domain-containing protein
MKKFVPLIISLIILYLSFSDSYAGNNNLQANSYHFSEFNKQDGLSNNQISDIFQDSHGFLWVTTYEGLNRFDGVHFINFNSIEAADEHIIPSFINVINEDNNENLWVGTSAGVAKIALNDYQITLYLIDLDTDIYVHDLLIDDEQKIWAATSNGLYRYSDSAEKFTKIELSKSTPADVGNISQITADVQGDIWFIDELAGVFKLNKKTLETYKLSDVYPQSTLLKDLSVIYFNEDKLWLGSYSGKVEIVNIKTNTVQILDLPFDIKKHRSGETIKSFVDDQKGKVWIATMGNGLYVASHNGAETEHFYRDVNLDFSLKDNSIWTIYRDKDQRMWLGTDGAGVFSYDGESHLFNHYFPDINNPESIRDKIVWSIFQDSQQKLWVGGDKGVDVLNSKRQKEFSLRHSLNDSNSLTGERVFTITEYSEGYMWLSTQGGLNRFDRKNKTNKRYYHDPDNPKSLPSNNITNLFIVPIRFG